MFSCIFLSRREISFALKKKVFFCDRVYSNALKQNCVEYICVFGHCRKCSKRKAVFARQKKLEYQRDVSDVVGGERIENV